MHENREQLQRQADTVSGESPGGAEEMPQGSRDRSVTVAGVHDALLGGKDCSLAERAVASGMVQAGADLGRAAWAGREFVRRAVAFLAAGGMRQFVSLGCGYPWTGLHVHEVAQQAESLARVVYVDLDPVVVAHRAALSRCAVSVEAGEFHEGGDVEAASVYVETTSAVEGDAREPGKVLTHPRVRALLDAGTPLAVLMCGVLEHLSDQDAMAAVDRWRELLPLGSALVISHVSASPVAGDRELAAGLERAARVHSDHVGPFTPRSRAQVEELFAGWTLLRPGLTRADRWRAATLLIEGAYTPDADSESPRGDAAGRSRDVVPVAALAGVAALGKPDLLGVPDALGAHAWTEQRRTGSGAVAGSGPLITSAPADPTRHGRRPPAGRPGPTGTPGESGTGGGC